MSETVKLVRSLTWSDPEGRGPSQTTTEIAEVKIDWLGRKPEPRRYTYCTVGEWRIAEELPPNPLHSSQSKGE